jgi:ankyrin repeat protein
VVVRLLLEKGADITVAEKHRWTALHNASQTGQEVIFELLLQQGTAVNSTDTTGRTPLSHAASNGHTGIVAALLALKSVNLDLRDHFG